LERLESTEAIYHLIEGSFPTQDRFEEGEEKSLGREFARAINDQRTLNCQRVKLGEEYGGAVGGLVTAKVIEHNKPADSLVVSKKEIFFRFNFLSIS
jgi:hypothetical protein